jgi:hypothetical protein
MCGPSLTPSCSLGQWGDLGWVTARVAMPRSPGRALPSLLSCVLGLPAPGLPHSPGVPATWAGQHPPLTHSPGSLRCGWATKAIGEGQG